MSVATEEYVFDQFDRDAGSGSLSSEQSEKDENVVYEREQMDDRRTGFNPNDVESEYSRRVDRFNESYDQWEWLNLFDSGVRSNGSQSRGQQQREDDKVRDIEIFSRQLNLTDYQIDRVKHLFQQIDLNTYKPDYTSVDVVFTLISLVQNEDVVVQENDVRKQDMWTKLMIEMNVDEKDIRKLRGEFHELL